MEDNREARKRQNYRYFKDIRDKVAVQASAAALLDQILTSVAASDRRPAMIDLLAQKERICEEARQWQMPAGMATLDDFVKCVVRVILSRLHGDYGLSDLMQVAKLVCERQEDLLPAKKPDGKT